MHAWLRFGHLVGVMVLVLGTGVFVAGVESLRRAAQLQQLRAAMGVATLGVRLLVPGGAAMLGFGITLAVRHWSLADAWITAALALVALLGVNGLHAELRLTRLRRALAQAGDGPVPRSLLRLSRAPALHVSNRAGLPVLAELEFLMTVRPDAGAIAVSLLVTAATVALVALTVVPPVRRRAGA